MWTIFQMLIEWTVVRYVQSFDKQYSQIRKHHIRNLKFQLKRIKFKRYHIYYRPCLDTRLSQSPVTNACFWGFFPASQPPVSALHKRGQRRRAWKRQQKQIVQAVWPWEHSHSHLSCLVCACVCFLFHWYCFFRRRECCGPNTHEMCERLCLKVSWLHGVDRLNLEMKSWHLSRLTVMDQLSPIVKMQKCDVALDWQLRWNTSLPVPAETSWPLTSSVSVTCRAVC